MHAHFLRSALILLALGSDTPIQQAPFIMAQTPVFNVFMYMCHSNSLLVKMQHVDKIELAMENN